MHPHSVLVRPGNLQGTLRVPASKSFMQRLLAALWIRGGVVAEQAERLVRDLGLEVARA